MLRVVSSPNPFLGKHAAAFQVVSSPAACAFVTVTGWTVKPKSLPLGKAAVMFLRS